MGQYLQHPKIAKDFTNYLELYDKYQSRYQVEEILSGVIQEQVCDQAARASFDERLSLVGLLLAKLSSQFAVCKERSDQMELLMKRLRRFQELSGETSLDQIVLEFASEYEEKKRAELLTLREDRRYRQVLSMLEEWSQAIKGMGKKDAGEIWNQLRIWFGEKSDDYEAMVEQGGSMLEHAFDFMEAAFGDSQEMVMFVTELNSRYYSVSFLQEYQCERYYEYNKRLLFDDREAEILKQLEEKHV